MKFSIDWLKQYIKGNLPNPEKLAELLTLHSFETVVGNKGKQPALDIKLLANRVADSSGHLGVAKEIAALIGAKYQLPQFQIHESKEKINDFLDVKIENTKTCPRYMARLIKGIKVSSSPLWMQNRLKACGLKPINNVVDVTNYVMLEYGQPIHAFDYDLIDKGSKAKKHIKVRMAKPQEKIITLDNENRILDKDILVISDSNEALGIAGIKGGQTSGISHKTKSIVIEAANFDPVLIRKASQKLDLATDASWRFQHNLTIQLPALALERVASLIQEICGGEIVRGKIDVGEFIGKKVNVLLNINKARKFLGFDISAKDIEKSLSALGFDIKKVKPEVYLIKPPIERQDIEFSEDVIGEVVRFIGYDKVPSLPAKQYLNLPKQNELFDFTSLIRDWIKVSGLEEVYNYAFLSPKEKNILSNNWQKPVIEILNPNSAEYQYLKPTLISGLVKNIHDNFRFYNKVHLFEIANVFQYDGKDNKEKLVFSGVFGYKDKTNIKDIYTEIKGLISGLFTKLGFDKNDFSFVDKLELNYADLLDKNYCVGIYLSNKFIGAIGKPNKDILKFYDISSNIMVWEISVKDLMNLTDDEREYEPLPKYPSVMRDLSIFVNQPVLIDTILRLIQGASPKCLEDTDLFDIFEGQNMPNGKKSLAFHLIFRAKDKTLNSREVDKEMNKINKALKEFGAEIR